MLLIARIAGLVGGPIVGVIIDEQLFEGSPEWTSSITPTIFAVLGWVVVGALARWLTKRTVSA